MYRAIIGPAFRRRIIGNVDEHYCSDCKRSIDKVKEQYIEAEFPNQKDPVRTNRVFLCRRCAAKSKITVGGTKVSLWNLFRRLRHRGNPPFEIGVHCYAAPVCDTYAPRKGRLNCRNIAVTPDGRVYCKRNHPGFAIVPQEKAVVEQARFNHVLNYLKRFGKTVGFKNLRQILATYGLDPVNAKTVTPLGPVGKDVTPERRKDDRRSRTAADWLIGTVKSRQERAAERRRTT